MSLPVRPIDDLLERAGDSCAVVERLCGMAVNPTGVVSQQYTQVRIGSDHAPIDLVCRLNDSDAEAFYELFVLTELPPEWARSARDWRVVVDLGAHVGLFSSWLGQFAPDASYELVEPLLENFQLCKRNAMLHPPGTWRAHRAAIGPTDGSTLLWNSAWSTSGSIVEAVGRHRQGQAERFEHRFRREHQTVPSWTLDTLFRRLRIGSVDLLKMDIEGAELEVLRGGAALLDRVRNVAIEIHDKYVDGAHVRAILQNAGFRPVGRTYGLEYFSAPPTRQTTR